MGLLYFTSLAIAASLRSSAPWNLTIASLSVCQGFTALPAKPRREFSLGLPKLHSHGRLSHPVDSFAFAPLNITTLPSEDDLDPEIAQTLEAQALFDKWDEDGTGTLDITQLRQLVSEIFPDAIWNKRAVERLVNEGMTKSGLLIEFNHFYTWLNLQMQTESLVDKTGAYRHVVSHDHVMELAKHFDGGSSTLSIEEISYEEIQGMIDVSRPYYALANEGRVTNWLNETIGFVAEISPEMPATYEADSIGLAEICRHLAIAGSVAAAMSNPKKGKHYYLALDGFARHNEVLPNPLHDSIDELIPRMPGKMRLFAYSINVGKREATSEAFLYTGDKNDDVIRINISYKIIPTKLFQRFYPAIEHTKEQPVKQLMPGKHKNPYTDKIDISIANIKKMDNKGLIFSAHIPSVSPAKCLGHFDVSPCLPVAFLLGHLVNVAGQSIARLFDDNGIEARPSLVAKDGILKAAALVQAGTNGIKIEGETRQIRDGLYHSVFNLFRDDNSNDHIAFFEFTLQRKLNRE